MTGLYGLTIRTVCTDRKDTFRSGDGPKIASHIGNAENFHVISEKGADQVQLMCPAVFIQITFPLQLWMPLLHSSISRLFEYNKGDVK